MTKLKRIEDYNKVLPIIELYPCVQSEGSRAGYPTIAIRTTGCTHRCFFGEGGWCDSWYTSIHPEKGIFTFNDIIKMYDDNPHITEMMLTGGSPTMHSALVNELTHFAEERGIFITIETEGSHYLETDYRIGLLSISPKFNNSVPVVGVKTPQGVETTEQMVKQHNKFRLNYEAIAKSIMYHNSYHIKPVVDKDLAVMPEVEEFLSKLAEKLIELSEEGYPSYYRLMEPVKVVEELIANTWLMPAGDTRKALMESYGPVMNLCRDRGYKFTPRPHIIAFDDMRGV